jgi:hypothetical protein
MTIIDGKQHWGSGQGQEEQYETLDRALTAEELTALQAAAQREGVTVEERCLGRLRESLYKQQKQQKDLSDLLDRIETGWTTALNKADNDPAPTPDERGAWQPWTAQVPHSLSSLRAAWLGGA